MLTILSDSVENAGRLSGNLQYYWNTQGVYASVSLFENDVEFCTALSLHIEGICFAPQSHVFAAAD